MSRWVSGVRGAVLMILTWTVGWGVGFGGVMEAFVDPHGELVDIWPALMAFYGFIGGAVMAGLLRGLHEVAPARFAVSGVVTGLALGLLAVAMGLSSDIAIDQPYQRPVAPLVLIGIVTVMGTVAAIGSAVFFRLVAGKRGGAVATG